VQTNFFHQFSNGWWCDDYSSCWCNLMPRCGASCWQIVLSFVKIWNLGNIPIYQKRMKWSTKDAIAPSTDTPKCVSWREWCRCRWGNTSMVRPVVHLPTHGTDSGRLIDQANFEGSIISTSIGFRIASKVWPAQPSSHRSLTLSARGMESNHLARTHAAFLSRLSCRAL
jgi:hypothetical protein